MGTYYVADGDGTEHRVDHPPIFACREHKSLLRFSARFVAELLAVAQDVMPGNMDEIANAYMKGVGPAYRLPDFLIPPKVFLFNPQGLRGPEALPYSLVLVDKKFFGIPLRYLTPDRFDGCDICKTLKPRRPRRPSRGPDGRRGPSDSSIRRRGPGPSGAPRRGPPRPSGARQASGRPRGRPPE